MDLKKNEKILEKKTQKVPQKFEFQRQSMYSKSSFEFLKKKNFWRFEFAGSHCIPNVIMMNFIHDK